jgi:DNA-binding beta-propeller fold protein YncE
VGNAIIPALNTTGLDVFFGIDNNGIDIIATNSSMPPVTTSCPQIVSLAQTAPPPPAPPVTFTPIHVDIGQGTFHPINFFLSPDSTQVYIVASDRNSVLVYNFSTNATSGIALANNATPVAADISADGTLIYVAGSDGLLHQLNTGLALDQNQISFPPLPNSTNSFCFTTTNCQLNVVAVKP